MSKIQREARSSFLKVFPVLAVDDLTAALDYYHDKLGFSIAWEWGEPATRAGVARDEIEVQLLSDPALRPKAPGTVYCHMTGIEQFYRECVERGAEITSELELRPWGMLDFRLVDTSGNQLGFGEEQTTGKDKQSSQNKADNRGAMEEGSGAASNPRLPGQEGTRRSW